jgi:tetratricopeptide (TPR) repeat protein
MRKPLGRRVVRALIFPALLLAAAALPAQEAKQYTAESPHYRVFSEASQSQAEEIARRMEACLRLYNDIFHYDLAQLPAKMRVRVLKDAASFNAYLTKILSQTRADFVFVAYSDAEKSELLCYPRDEKSFSASLIHQGCIQFLKAFVANPPVWLREGVATALESAAWDARAAAYMPRPNFAWLDTLKTIIRGETPQKLIPVTDLLMLTREMAQAKPDVFYPQSWGLVHFLLSSPEKSYNRMLWDSIAAVDPKATLEDNSQRVRRRAFSWAGEEALSRDFEAFILSQKTAGEWLRDGMDAYGKGDLAAADAALARSLDVEPENGAAWYYLGLVSYTRKDHAKAEEQYLKAFELGVNAGLINYALGVNAFAAGKSDMAVKYLQFAKDADKPAYGEKVDALLKRIQAGK